MRNDDSLLQAALIGYQHQRELIEAKIAEIQSQLGSSADTSSLVTSKRGLNTSARKRIAAAQRKRWAEFHEQRGESVRPKKRRMSAEGRERIAEATRKRWAQFRADKAAAQKAAARASKKKPAASVASQSEAAG